MGGRTTAASLRPGAIVTLRTAVSSLTGRLEFIGRNLQLVPVTKVNIPPGKSVRLLVLSTTPQLRLKLLPDSLPAGLSVGRTSSSPARQILNALGLHRIDGADEVVRALINSQRELSPEMVRMLSIRLGRDLSDRSRHRRARVVVELADREIDLDKEEDHRGGLIPPFTDGRWDGDGRSGNYRSRKGSTDHKQSTRLRAYLSRTTSSPSHALQLFNHLKSSGDLHWVVIPIGARRAKYATNGTLRVGIDQTDHTPREATLALGVGSGVWWFSWTIGNGSVRLVSCETDKDAPRIPESLLARISGRGHTNTDQYKNGDGFSGTSSEVNKLGVDEYG
ncbi:MAG: hypothetical protein WD492_08845 [Alkalispirochaeta sp.]